MSKPPTLPLFGRIFATATGYLKLLVHKDTPWQAKLVLGAALLYLVLPFDLIPDWLLGLGIVDDLGVVTLLVWLALKILRQYTLQKENGTAP